MLKLYTTKHVTFDEFTFPRADYPKETIYISDAELENDRSYPESEMERPEYYPTTTGIQLPENEFTPKPTKVEFDDADESPHELDEEMNNTMDNTPGQTEAPQTEKRYPDRVMEPPVRFTINALRKVDDEDKPTVKWALSGHDKREWEQAHLKRSTDT